MISNALLHAADACASCPTCRWVADNLVRLQVCLEGAQLFQMRCFGTISCDGAYQHVELPNAVVNRALCVTPAAEASHKRVLEVLRAGTLAQDVSPK